MTTHVSPPRAIILAAGMGSRLRPLTIERPKPLVEVHGTPILHNALRQLANVGVKHVTIVVGYRKEVIERSCGRKFAGVAINYVQSAAFDQTGSAYSLWLARETLLRGDVLLLEGDVFFEEMLLQRVLRHHGDVAAVDVFDGTMTGSAACLSPQGGVTEFRMNQNGTHLGGESLYKTVNIYRFTAGTLRRTLVPGLDAFIASGGSKGYIEQFLAPLTARRELDLQAVVCRGIRWFEIDNEADLRIAEAIFAPIASRSASATNPSAVAAEV
jgi:NDP-sugar pyrophosphorylase family protein